MPSGSYNAPCLGSNVGILPSPQHGTYMFSTQIFNHALPDGESIKNYSPLGTTVLSSISHTLPEGESIKNYPPLGTRVLSSMSHALLKGESIKNYSPLGTTVLSSMSTLTFCMASQLHSPPIGHILYACDHICCKALTVTYLPIVLPGFYSFEHSMTWMTGYLHRKRSFIMLRLILSWSTYRKHDFQSLLYGLYGVSLRNSDQMVLPVTVYMYLTMIDIQITIMLCIVCIHLIDRMIIFADSANSLSACYVSIQDRAKFYFGCAIAHCQSLCNQGNIYGGRAIAKRTVKGTTLMPFLSSTCSVTVDYNEIDFQFVEYIPVEDAPAYLEADNNLATFNLPLAQLADFLSRKELSNLAKMHGFVVHARDSIKALSDMFVGHEYKVCPKHVSLFKAWDTDGLRKAKARLR